MAEVDEDRCLTLSCPRPPVVLLVVSHADARRQVRPYCEPCATERRDVFGDRILDEVTLPEGLR